MVVDWQSCVVRGHVRARSGAWEIRAYAGVDVRTGKRRYVTRTVHGSKANAERALKALVVEVESGRQPRTGATVGELLEAWFAVASPGFSPRTVLETRGVMDRRLIPDLGPVALRHLSVARLDGYYAGLLEHGSVGGERLAPGSVRRIHGILRRALHYGVRWGWLMVNPAAEAVLAPVPPPRISPPSTPGVARLYALAHREDPLLGLFVFVAAVTGARRSELCALRWSNVAIANAARAVMVVDRAVVFGPDGLGKKPTKTRQSRRIAFDEATVARLPRYRRQAEAVARNSVPRCRQMGTCRAATRSMNKHGPDPRAESR